MKALFMAVVLVLCVSVSAWAAGSTSVTCTSLRNSPAGQPITDSGNKTCMVSFTADASDGSVPSSTVSASTYGLYGLNLYAVETNPGSTAPTDNWDVAITDSDSVDVCGNTANRDQSNSEYVYCATSTQPYKVVDGDLTVAITGNSVNSATGTVKLIFVK